MVYVPDYPSVDGMIRVATPIKDGPAYKAGIRAGDVITKITLREDKAGEPLDQPREISTTGLRLSEVEKLLWEGARGTKLKLTILAPNAKDPIQCEVPRERVEAETVLGCKRKANDAWDYFIEPKKKIGYIRLTKLTENTARDLNQALEQLHGQASSVLRWPGNDS
jgi:carboxyl-terminal processing protease